MASKVTLDSLSNYNGIKTVWSQQSQSISGNTSVLRATITQYSTAWTEWKSNTTLTLKADGQTKTVTVTPFNWSGANSRSLGYVDFTVDHKDDGKQSSSISHSWSHPRWPQSKSGTFSFDTIPRTSSFTIPSSFNVGSAFTVSITRASSSFTHQISLHDGSTSLYWSANTVGTSGSVNLSADTLLARMSGVISKTFRVLVSTWNGSTYIGESSQNITAYIPASTFTIPGSFTMGNTFTTTISRVGSLTHQISLHDGSTSLYWSDNTVATSGSVNVALSTLAARSPNSMSRTFTVEVSTWNGNTYIGSTSKTIIGNVPTSLKPTFDAVTVSENVSSVASLVGAYVQNKSRLNLAITGASGIYGSTIRSYNITGVGHNANSSSTLTGYLSVSGNQTIKGTVTDSRGQTFEKPIVVNILPYTPPTLSELSFRRTLPDKTEAPLGDNVTVSANVKVQSLIVNGVEKNSIWYQVQSAQSGGSFATKADTTYAGLTKSYSDVWSGYSVDYSYNFRVRAGDVFGFGGWSVGIVPTGIVTQQWGSKTTSFGKMIDDTRFNVQVGTGGIQSDGPIVVEGPTTFSGGINSISVNGRDMNTITETGFYQGYHVVNAMSQSISTFIVNKYSHDWIVQIQIITSANPQMFIRSRFNGTTWSGWSRVLSTVNTADYVIETGSNSKGSWEKWHSGKMVQTMTKLLVLNSNTWQYFPFPQNFVGAYSVEGSLVAEPTTGSGTAWYDNIHKFTFVRFDHEQCAALIRGVNVAASGWADVVATGRWK